jgi:hypothetical protein
LRLVERASRVGAGWAITINFSATRKTVDMIKNREALASALTVDEVQLLVECVRGNGRHAGRVTMWVADAGPSPDPRRHQARVDPPPRHTTGMLFQPEYRVVDVAERPRESRPRSAQSPTARESAVAHG